MTQTDNFYTEEFTYGSTTITRGMFNDYSIEKVPNNVMRWIAKRIEYYKEEGRKHSWIINKVLNEFSLAKI